MCADAWRFQQSHPAGFGSRPRSEHSVNTGAAVRPTVIGTGDLGADLGHEVLRVDTDEATIEAPAAGRPPFHEPALGEVLFRNVDADRLRLCTPLGEAAPGDAR
jgi:hypothetical protein